MMWPKAQFVSAPAPTATVRYNFHDRVGAAKAKITDDGFSLGWPSVEGDPDGVGGEYGLRTLEFVQCIVGTKADAMARQSQLARELVRANNWVLFQLNPSRPAVWFQTYRADPGQLDLVLVDADDERHKDHWHISVRLPAEPFAWGERVTLPAVTINNDPAHATNPCSYVLPAIKGDAPAPLRIKVNPSAAAGMHGYRWMVASAALDESSWSPIVFQIGTGDGWTLGADVGSPAANAAYSGGSYRPISFSTQAGLVDRISGTAPSTIRVGRYKLLHRGARSDISSTFSFRLGQMVGLSYKYGDTVVMDRGASTTNGHATWIDLGDFTFPFGNQAPDGETGLPYPPDISLQVGRLTGLGSWFPDAFMFVPIETVRTRESRTLSAEFPEFGVGPGAAFAVWDGDLEAFWAVSQFGVADACVPELAGQFPRATPGALNVVTMLQQVNGRKSFWAADASDSITATAAVEFSYHPRHLMLGDGS